MLDVDCEEVEKLRGDVERLKRKNTTLNDDLQSLRLNYTNVSVECEEKTKVNERLVKKTESELKLYHEDNSGSECCQS